MKRALLNGKPAKYLSLMDRALHYGDGLFETLRVQDGRIPLWPYHWQRLQQGCRRLGLAPPEEMVLQQEIDTLIAGEARAVLKLIVSRGPGERGYAVPQVLRPSRILLLSDRPNYAADFWQTGIRVYACETPCSINPVLAGIKHLNRLEQVLARQEWQGGDYQEGVLCDPEGHVIEGTMSNIFWVKNKALYTPDLARCGVRGVMREIVMELAQHRSFALNVGLWSKNELCDAEEIFITNSLIGVWPVSYIFNNTFQAGPVTRQLQAMLQAEYAF